MASEKKQLIIELHQYVKSLMLEALEYEIEENEISLISTVDQNRALSHIVTIMAFEEGISGISSEDCEKSFEEAFSFLYHAFWGIAEWIRDDICGRIITIMEPFSDQCIDKVIPDYYKTKRPGFERLRLDINKEKDRIKAPANQGMIKKVDGSYKEVKKLLGCYDEIKQNKGALQDLQKKQKRSGASDKRFQIYGIILAAVLAAVLAFFFGRLSTRLNNIQKLKESPVEVKREAKKEIPDPNQKEEAIELKKATQLEQEDPN